jgi:acyl-CoA thioesterase I
MRTFICAVIAASVVGCGGSDDRESTPVSDSPEDTAMRAPGRPTILFFGTSLTAGYGLAPEKAFPAIIGRTAASEGLPIEVVNAGLSGETSAGARRRIEWVLRQPADLIVIETGANDGLRALRVDSTKVNIQAVIDRARATHPTARIALVQMEAMPNLGRTYTTAFRRMYVDLARDNKITLIPFLLEKVAGHDSLNLSDGVHPNEAGAAIVAANVWRSLKPIVQELRTAR